MIQSRLYAFLLLIAGIAAWMPALGRDTDNLRRECSKAMSRRDFNTTRRLAGRLYELTRNDTASADYAYACFYLGSAELFAGDSRTACRLIGKAKDIAESTGTDSLTGMALNCLGIYEANVNSNYYLAQHYLLRSLDYPDMNGSVYSNLAQIARLQKDTSGMEYARKVLQYGRSRKDPYYVYGGLVSVAEFHIMKGEYQEAEKTLSEAMEMADREKFADRSRLQFLQAVILSHLDRTEESNAMLFDLQDSIRTRIPIYLPELQFVVGKNYEKQGDYANSNTWLLKALESGEAYGTHDYDGMILRQLADNYRAQGDMSRSLEFMTRASDYQEKVAKTERDRMIRERALTMEVMEQEREKSEAIHEMRIHRILTVSLAILLLAALFIIWYVVRTLRQRNRLYRKIVSHNVSRLREEKKGEEDGATTANPVEEARLLRSKALFDSLQDLMREKRLYRNPLLTREEVIETLGTNSTYLTQCIRENANMNYSQYINSFRVADAIDVLSDTSRLDTPIKAIADEVGFNSLTTFYKLFQQATGISPSAYRKSLINITEHDQLPGEGFLR